MTLAMPMTRSERVYHAILSSARGQRRNLGTVAVWIEGKLRRASGSAHMTPAAQRARRLLRLVGTYRWH